MREFGTLVIVVVFFGLSCFAFLGALKESPKAYSVGDDVMLQWDKEKESEVQRFNLLWRNGRSEDFILIASIHPVGGSLYRFVDQFAAGGKGSMHQYKIQTVNGEDPTSESEVMTVSHPHPMKARAWRSIKALFR
jgi:hypothetical protein